MVFCLGAVDGTCCVGQIPVEREFGIPHVPTRSESGFLRANDKAGSCARQWQNREDSNRQGVLFRQCGMACLAEEDGKVDTDAWSVRPLSFKTFVGRGHPDFSSGHQQDSAHYFMHLLEIMDIAEKAAGERLPLEDVLMPCLNFWLLNFVV